MTNQHRLPFQDPESVTRRPALNVVHAHVESVADFNESYFAGYNVFRALTYTSSIPMVANLSELVSDAHLVIAHNARFDRPVVERVVPTDRAQHDSPRLYCATPSQSHAEAYIRHTIEAAERLSVFPSPAQMTTV